MKKTALFIVLVAVLGGGQLFAQRIPEDAPPELVLKIVLDLTDDQVMAIQRLAEARATAVEPIVDRLHQREAEMEAVLTSDAPDPLAVGQLVLTIRALQDEIGRHHDAFREGFRSILTPDQMERVGHINQVALANRAAEALNQLGLR